MDCHGLWRQLHSRLLRGKLWLLDYLLASLRMSLIAFFANVVERYKILGTATRTLRLSSWRPSRPTSRSETKSITVGDTYIRISRPSHFSADPTPSLSVDRMSIALRGSRLWATPRRYLRRAATTVPSSYGGSKSSLQTRGFFNRPSSLGTPPSLGCVFPPYNVKKRVQQRGKSRLDVLLPSYRGATPTETFDAKGGR